MPNKTTPEDINKILAKRLLAIFAIGILSLFGMLKFGPKIGALFGMISVNRNETINPPQANTPPPVFVEVPKAVNETKVNIKGMSAPKTKIELFVNGPKAGEVITDMSGEFLFTEVALNKGKNTLFAKANDTKSETITIDYDDEDPEIEIESPKDGDKIENLNERIEIVGEISEKATIKINDRVAIQKPDNSFVFLLGAKEGEMEITIKATDLAGNTAEEKLKVTYKRD
ncbi:hypothetical protein GF360_02710 [candidate division WWE3 bacterium]|nr:hypothetical protein [candidate division WWE3 bacterium]